MSTEEDVANGTEPSKYRGVFAIFCCDDGPIEVSLVCSEV
jgi:hypothetical protein